MKFPKLTHSLARRRASGGYSIAEVMMAVGVTGGTVGTVLAGFSLAMNILENARENLRAIQVLQEKMEAIRLCSWEQIKTAGFVPSTFTASMNPTNSNSGLVYSGTMVITDVPFAESYSSNMVQVQATLNWTSGSVNHSQKMTTFVSRYGLQNYLYQ